MKIETMVEYLDRPDRAESWFHRMGIRDAGAAHRNFVAMAQSGVTLDLLAQVGEHLSEYLPQVSDADRVLNNLERFLTASRSPLALASLFDRDPDSLATLLQLFSTSQHLSDLLISDPETFDLLRITDGQTVGRELLVAELLPEIRALPDDGQVMNALRRFKRRETLRIAYGDVVKRQSIEVVTRQISLLAETLCEAALQAAWQRLLRQRSAPLRVDGKPAREIGRAHV